MTGLITKQDTHEGVFRNTINSATLPSIDTFSVPSGKTWIAYGVCKLQQSASYSVAQNCSTARQVSTTINRHSQGCCIALGCNGFAQSGTSGGTEGGCRGGDLNKHWQIHCARWCAHYCARYCGVWCGLRGYGYGFAKGYGFGFGYGYAYARGYSDDCLAIATRGNGSWTQIVPTGFTVTTWLYYEEETNA